LEDRALLSAVSYNATTDRIVFNADADVQNAVFVSSPDSDTLVIRGQVLAGGLLVDDPFALQDDAVGNPDFSLDASGSTLTIDISGSPVELLTINTFEDADQIFALSSPASTTIDVFGGGDSDVLQAGIGFRMDTLFGDLNFDGGVGSDRMELVDLESTVSDTITLTDTSVVGISPGDIGYSNIEDLMIDTTDLTPVTVDILSTNADTDTEIDLTFADASSNPVPAIVTVGNRTADAATSVGNMSLVRGDVELRTQSGSLTLNIEDGGDSSGDTATISETAVAGFSAGTITYTLNTEFDSFSVEAGSGSDSVDASTSSSPLLIDAGEGDDQITGSSDNDTIFGRDGNDTLNGSGGSDVIFGDIGADSITGGDGADTLLGGNGADDIDGGAGSDSISGEAGDDTIAGGSGDDVVEGNDGQDILTGGDGNDRLSGGFDDDVVTGEAGDDILFGDFGEDTLIGGGGADSIQGGLGDDSIRGGGGRDSITWQVGEGNDEVDGGNPTGQGQGGFDEQILIGTFGADVFVVEQQGDDVVVQVAGDTVSVGTSIEDLNIIAGDGNDRITIGDIGGSVERVVVNGDAGADRIDGRAMTTTRGLFTGGSGGDVIYGGDLDDTLRGGAGDDTMSGGGGDDSLKGSSGRDRMFWEYGDGSDIVDAGQAGDRLTVDTSAEADEVALGYVADTGTIINLPGSATVTMTGVDTLELNTHAGADVVTAGTMTGSDLQRVVADLAQGPDRFDMAGIAENITARVFGGTGNDSLFGGPADDVLRGSSDKDVLSGGGGDDELIGDSGDDWLIGGNGNDRMDGDSGSDTLMGKDGDDFIQGGSGADSIEGDAGDDSIFAASGKDRVEAGDGNDIVSGGLGSDDLDGGQGKDLLIGGQGSDTVAGRGGMDLLIAGSVNATGAELDSIHAEWLSIRSYDERLENLTGVDGNRVLNEDQRDPNRENTEFSLLPITGDRTVFDDEMEDILEGNAGRDLFFADLDTDLASDRTPSEDQIDLR
jgi:Ca2+-binding RTX toxin-like protein